MATTLDTSRFERLEDRVNNESEKTSRLAGAYEHLATKEDLAKSENRIIKWIVGIAITILIGMIVQTSLLWQAVLSLSGQ